MTCFVYSVILVSTFFKVLSLLRSWDKLKSPWGPWWVLFDSRNYLVMQLHKFVLTGRAVVLQSEILINFSNPWFEIGMQPMFTKTTLERC